MGEYGDQSNTEETPDDRDPDGIASDEKTPRVRGIQSYIRMQKLFTDPSPVWLTPNWHRAHFNKQTCARTAMKYCFYFLFWTDMN